MSGGAVYHGWDCALLLLANYSYSVVRGTCLLLRLRADTLAATAETTDVVLREAHEALGPKVK